MGTLAAPQLSVVNNTEREASLKLQEKVALVQLASEELYKSRERDFLRLYGFRPSSPPRIAVV